MRTNKATTLAPDGTTTVTVEYTLEKADPSSGVFSETLVIHEVYLEDGTPVGEDYEGDMEWYEQVSRFLTDPWYAEYNPYTDPDYAYDSGR